MVFYGFVHLYASALLLMQIIGLIRKCCVSIRPLTEISVDRGMLLDEPSLIPDSHYTCTCVGSVVIIRLFISAEDVIVAIMWTNISSFLRFRRRVMRCSMLLQAV